MKMLLRLKAELLSIHRYGQAEKLQNLGQHQLSLSKLENFQGSSEYMLKVLLLRAVNYHKLKDFNLALKHYEKFQNNRDISVLSKPDKDFLCAYAKFYGSAAKRHLDSDVVLQGSILELRELSKHASFKTKREFVV